MKRVKSIKLAQQTQGKFYNLINHFRQDFTKPEFKAISDITRGILTSGSTIVYQSAREIPEKTCPKKTAERFYRNLKREHFNRRIQQRMLEVQGRKVDKNTLILIDESDIMKRYAGRMEGLKKVRDASTGSIAPGYDLFNVVACKPQDSGYSLLPLSSDLVSQKIEVDGLRSLCLDRLIDITIHTGNRGIFVFDRGFDSWRIISELVQHDNSFIIRSTGRRHFEVDGKTQSIQEIRSNIDLIYRMSSPTQGKWFDCGIIPVRVRISDHPSRNAPMADMFLVVARHNGVNVKKKGWFYFLCRFPGRRLSPEDIVFKTLSSYRLRWKIEEVHRQVKQDFDWESMQLMSYTGLKNLNALLWLALSFLYSLKEDILLIALHFRRIMEPERGLRKLLHGFTYYRLFQVCREFFRNWEKYRHTRLRSRRREQMQLEVSFS